MNRAGFRTEAAGRGLLLAALFSAGLAACAASPADQVSVRPTISPKLTTNTPTELSLDELINIQVDSVYGASKYEQKVNQAPASVSIITSDDIKKFGYRTLADALRSVRGLYVTYDRDS